MADTWITDMEHYLEEGVLASDLPNAALNLALHLGAITAWMTSRDSSAPQRTNVPCRRSPGRRRCLGEIQAMIRAEDGTIVWRCPTCGDNGEICGWPGTGWDRRERTGDAAPPALLSAYMPAAGHRDIEEGARVPVRFTRDDRRVLEQLFIDPDYTARMRPVEGSSDLAGDYALDDLEDMLGYIAAEANHGQDPLAQAQLDDLYARLLRTQRSYDDGNWNDSGR